MESINTITEPSAMSPVTRARATSSYSWLAMTHRVDPVAKAVRVRTFAGSAKQDRPPRGAPH